MSTQPSPTRRRLLTFLAGGIVLGASPFGLGLKGGPLLMPSAAWARDGNDADDGGQGRGRGRGRGGDEDHDRDNDSSGRGSGDDHEDGKGSGGGDDGEDQDRPGDRDDSDSSATPSSSSNRASPPRDLMVLYPDGWTERIVNGRYELTDPESRLVMQRAATGKDFARMIALR